MRPHDWDDRSESGIAIVGMSGRFPGASDVNAYWQNLCDGIESISHFTPAELEQSGTDPSAFDDPNFVPAGSVLEDIDLFDANFFGISPREAESLDPQQRLFLEVAWSSLEDAGYDPDAYSGLIGVYGGCALSSYLPYLQTMPEFMGLLGYLQVYIGNDKDYLTTRVSYNLNLRGPSLSVQTACSTSLLAATVAADHLRSHQCDMALAGGVCVRVPQVSGYYYEPGGIYSPDGHCRVFDEKAEGVVFGNGVGVVVLKRLEDAVADGDAIYAVMRGWAVNNDGSGKSSYAAPSASGQADVIRRAQRMAGFDPETIGYVETHGTGTATGDPVEITALTEAFRASTDKTSFCAVGSVKTNIGHLDPAAGVAALIKTSLALNTGVIPPSINCDVPNPSIDFANSPFFVNRELTRWPRNGTPRRAGVSAFGIGGTNVHVVLEEPPARITNEGESSGPHVLLVSAKSERALEQSWRTLSDRVQDSDMAAADIAYTSQVGRKHWNYRSVLIYESATEIAALGRGDATNKPLFAEGLARPRSVAFMFSGQGAQYVHMASGLYEHLPVFRRTLDQCLELLAPTLPVDLRMLLYPRPEDATDARKMLSQTEFTQPALFTVEYSLARAWIDWGIAPSAMIGHSIGEYVAGCLAGVFSLEDGLSLVAARGRLMQQLPSGSMLAVLMHEDEVRRVVGDSLDIAATNEPSACVVSGPSEAIDALERQLDVDDVPCRRLETSHAFHSRMMDPILTTYLHEVERVSLRPPEIPYLSNVTGSWITAAEATNPAYWSRHIREPVRFGAGLSTLFEEKDRALVEVGPGQSLASIARRHPDRTPDQTVAQSLRHVEDQRPDHAVMLEALARLWLAGVPIDWPKVHAGRRRSRVHLPPYPYERRRYWPADDDGWDIEEAEPFKEPDLLNWFYATTWHHAPHLDSGPLAQGCVSLVFADCYGLADEIVDRLNDLEGETIVVQRGEQFAQRGARAYEIDPGSKDDYVQLLEALRAGGKVPERVLHLWGVTSAAADSTEASDSWMDTTAITTDQDLGYFSLLYLSQALVSMQTVDPVDILVASSRSQLLPGDDDVVPAKVMVLGACRAIPQEYPHLAFEHVDIEPVGLDRTARRRVALQLLDESKRVGFDTTVALRKDQRWIPVHEPLPLEEPSYGEEPWRIWGSYLITGGLGTIGLALAEHLALGFGAKVAVVSHTGLPSRASWEAWLGSHDHEDRTSIRITRIREIEAQGGEILVLTADVADQDAMSEALDAVYAEFGTLHGVIHAAGNVDSSGFFAIDEADKASCARQFESKIAGAVVLADLLREADLDFVLLLSSISSILAGLGYVAYAAANLFLDGVAARLSTESEVPWISVNLDSWEDDLEGLEEDPYRLVMNSEDGIEVLRRILARFPGPTVAVSTGDLDHRIDQWINPVSLRKARDREEAGRSRLHPRPDLATEYIAPTGDIEIDIAATVQELLGVSMVGTADDFFGDLGGTSLLATQLVARLRQKYPVDLPLRRFYEQPTVAELGQVIRAQQGEHVG